MKQKIDKNFWLREFTILRHKNLVYLATMKCACTYYINFFKSQGWQESTLNTVDWDADHVFSFMLDPMERRIKGLTEFVYANSRFELLNQDSLFWGGVLYLDMHSVPYTISYGDHAYQIDWIPLNSNTKDLLDALLLSYNIKYEHPAEYLNQSNPKKLNVYNIIKEKTHDGNFALHLGLEDDIKLYSDVSTNIKYWLVDELAPWEQISWLSK